MKYPINAYISHLHGHGARLRRVECVVRPIRGSCCAARSRLSSQYRAIDSKRDPYSIFEGHDGTFHYLDLDLNFQSIHKLIEPLTLGEIGNSKTDISEFGDVRGDRRYLLEISKLVARTSEVIYRNKLDCYHLLEFCPSFGDLVCIHQCVPPDGGGTGQERQSKKDSGLIGYRYTRVG